MTLSPKQTEALHLQLDTLAAAVLDAGHEPESDPVELVRQARRLTTKRSPASPPAGARQPTTRRRGRS